MEPLSALSVAAAVVQFLDFSGSVVSSTYAIYKSFEEHTSGTSNIESITVRLVEVNGHLEQSAGFEPTSQLGRDVVSLCRECSITAQSLLDALRKLSRPTAPSLWNSFKIALRSVWSQDRIETLQTQLQSYRQQISMYILVELRGQIQSLQQTNSLRAADINVSLETTQYLAQKILAKVDRQSKFHADIIRAINSSNSWNGSYQSRSLEPHRLAPRDLEDFNNGILHILKYEGINVREDKIVRAHRSTLGWIFEQSSSPSLKPSFGDWLQQDLPFYWIAGKAGSGKSTLMKYLHESPLLPERLERWAGGEELIVLSFFFWNVATKIQMSLEGMIRTMLYQALRVDTNLIPICFANRFEARLIFSDDAVYKPTMTWEELLGAFKAYIQEASKHAKLFLLIDGLDEFGGRPIEVIDFVKTLPGDRIKVCVSSRPLDAFEDAFGSKPNLRLHDLTRDDVRAFVEQNFRSNPGFVARETLDPDYAAKLIDNVNEKSSGVFLWVTLVVQSLMEGFSGGERLSDLQARLDELPSDLEQLFLQILSKLTPQQLDNSARFFQILRLARRPISSLEFSFVDEESMEVVFNMPIAPLPRQLQQARVEILKRRLNECCRGLIEVSYENDEVDPDGAVTYLHRTVNDFWARPENMRKLDEAQKLRFQPYTQLCLARIAMLKMNTCPTEEFFWDAVIHGIGYAQTAEDEGENPSPTLYSEIGRVSDVVSVMRDEEGLTFLDRYTDNPRSRRDIKYWTWPYQEYRTATNFVAFAVKLRLKSYLEYALPLLQMDKDAQSRIDICTLSLRFATERENSINIEHAQILRPVGSGMNCELIEMLLKHGADPNFRYADQTAWETFVHWDQAPLPTAEAFLAAGADPDIVLRSPLGKYENNPHFVELYTMCKRRKRQSKPSISLRFSRIWEFKVKAR